MGGGDKRVRASKVPVLRFPIFATDFATAFDHNIDIVCLATEQYRNKRLIGAAFFGIRRLRRTMAANVLLTVTGERLAGRIPHGA